MYTIYYKLHAKVCFFAMFSFFFLNKVCLGGIFLYCGMYFMVFPFSYFSAFSLIFCAEKAYFA